MFTNRYIFIYTTVLVVVVAALLAVAALLLQPFQDQNIKNEKMQNILQSAGIIVGRDSANLVYSQYITSDPIIDTLGNVISKTGGFDVETTSPMELPLYICEKDGQQIYIVPVRGAGLWGPIWGYLALKSDFSTLVGAIFDDQGETPGLGAEIAGAPFQKQFIGKQIFDGQGHFTSIEVCKGGVINTTKGITHSVDAISGGTITSKAVQKMLQDVLSQYASYLQKMQKKQANN